eukprot:3088400-Prorocentrum_lima.AAC.1
MWGSHAIKHWSTTQKPLPSAQARRNWLVLPRAQLRAWGSCQSPGTWGSTPSCGCVQTAVRLSASAAGP